MEVRTPDHPQVLWESFTVINYNTACSLLCSDGQKMSKRKKNYPDPGVIVNTYGADALR